MRILAASDIHGNQETYRWVTGVANSRDVELLVLAGDLLGYVEEIDDPEESQRASAARVAAILRGIPFPIYYVMGNDDRVELDPAAGFRTLHGKRVDHGVFNFVGYQYTLPFMGGINEKPETTIAGELALLEPLIDERTVLVTHSPAAGILDGTRLGPAGSVSLRELIVRRGVRAHIHGHVHSAFGRAGRHFNVAAGRERRAVIIDLESMVHEVVEAESPVTPV